MLSNEQFLTQRQRYRPVTTDSQLSVMLRAQKLYVAQALARSLSALDIRAGHHPLDQTPCRGPAHRPQRRVPVRPSA